MKRLLFFSFSFLILSFFLVPQVKAADLNIDCPASPTGCSKSGLDPLFSNSLDGFWYPGKSITKTLNLKNSGSETREMAIKGSRTSTINILENVMQVSIVGGSTVIWSGSVADFYDLEKIGMGTFAPGANLNYDFTVLMSPGAGNEYQNKETVFDLTLGFWGDAIITPAPTSAPGTVLGAGVSTPTCNDTKPAGVPILLSATAGVNSVKLTWSEGTGPLSYYLVAFGTASGLQQYGNPNIGGPGTTAYTINSLSGNTRYYFKVRAGNGCMPGDYSNEISATPTGVFVAGPPAGFAENVLGAETALGENLTPTPTPSIFPSPKVKGASTTNFNWWLIIILIALLGLIIFGLLLRRRFFTDKS